MNVVSVDAAARALEAGEVVAYPTETVYGLAADVASEAALDRLYALKGRPRERALSVLVPDLATALRWLPDLPAAARRLATGLWPGPLTLVVPDRDEVFPLVASARGVALRCPDHPVSLALARAARCRLSSTSCNRTGDPPARTAAEVAAAVGPDVPIADGSDAGGLAPSTVVAIGDDGAIELLRAGAVPLARILAVAKASDQPPAARAGA